MANAVGTPPVSSPPNAATNPAMSVAGGQPGYNVPGSIPSSGRTVTSAAQLSVQQIVQVEWGRTWFPADVLRINPNGMIRIHYHGWSRKFDEDVPLPRIQLAHEAAALPATAMAAATVAASQPETPMLSESGQPNYSGPGKVPSSGHKVVWYTQLKPGLIVQVAGGSSGTWCPGM